MIIFHEEPSSSLCFLTVSSLDGESDDSPWGLFYKDTNFIYEASTLMT